MALKIKANIPPAQLSVTPQPASKHFDIVLGLDFHFIKMPPPVVIPCPVVPFAAMVFDPMDYLHITIPAMPVYSGEGGFSLQTNVPMGGTVIINGCYRAAATTGVLPLPPVAAPVPGRLQQMAGLSKQFNPLHAVLPKPVFMFPHMAPHDGQVSHGSKTVITAGSEQSALLCAVYSCADLGGFVPNMPTGLFNNYATAIIAVLPFGKPVLVGGPFVPHKYSVADLVNALMMMAIMKGSTKLLTKTLGKLLSKMNRALMERFPAYRAHGSAVQPHICKYLGEPVDAASGHMASLLQGFELPGPIPFVWEANYYSDSSYSGPMGKSIYHSYDITLQVLETEQLILLRDQYGCAVPFPLLEPGNSWFNPRDKYTLHRSKDGVYTAGTKNGLYYAFNHFASQQGFHKLRSISDRNGFAVRLNYDIRGNLVKIADSTHREIIVVNDVHGRITTIQLPHPDFPGVHIDAVRYTYDEEGHLVQFQDAMGHCNGLQWKNDLVIARRFKDGTVFRFEYNHDRQCTAALGPDGLYSYRFAYHKGFTIATNSLGYSQTYHHHAGLVTRVVNSQAAECVYRYDRYRNLLGIQDELGRVTNYYYDERGNTIAIGLPGQGITGILYNSQDLPLQINRPNGGVWQYTYDEAGNLVEQTNAAGGTILYTYTHGLLSQITNAGGHTTQLRYNSRYALSEIILPDNGRVRYSYDTLGRCTQLEDMYGNHQLRKYDFNGHLIEIRDPDGNVQHLQYDAMGNTVRAWDKLYQVELSYNFFGNITSRKQGTTAIEYVYDKEGQLLLIRNEHAEQYRFDLDSEGRVIRETGFDGLTRNYRRDAAGQVIEMLRPGNRTTCYEYDTAGRMIQARYTDNSTEVFAYDNLNQLVKATNSGSSVSLQRDLLGRVIAETLEVKEQPAVSVQYTYDTAGNRAFVNSSLGAAIAAGYNRMGDVTSLTAGSWHCSYARDEAGNETRRSTNNGIELQWHYDRFGRPAAQQVLHGKTTLKHRNYNWGIGNRLLAISDTQTGIVQFKHDLYGNLTELVYGNGKTEYRLPDAAGNLFEARTQTDRRYGAGGKLLKAKDTSYCYDAEGNLVQKEANGCLWTYVWNDNGSLRQVIRPDGNEVNFSYDALGRRICKRFKQTTTHWVWDGDTPLHEWKTFDTRNSTPGDIITWVFEPGSFVPVARLKGGKNYSIIADHLGTPTEMYAEDGTRLWQGQLDGYGRMRIQQGEPGSCPFRYQGQYEDAETGLYYNRFRYYSPAGGMYISQDPVGLHGGMRLYSYVHDNNIQIDPFGLAPVGYIFELPSNPQDLIDIGWQNITHPAKYMNTNMIDLMNPSTGQKIEFHPGKPGELGWEGIDHYHLHNPYRTSKFDHYLDRAGNPIAKGADKSHIKPTCK
ncbi:RHS repeat-associated core domain-containing protein [Deminuibacter soli]|uniref:RHS repeat protein n=1 Tax=Deminuibacter soli TaxID=2291815 RepID=A0A3E1NRM0_9BACT|nr:RHS repeat-associated core domain-containing protein [Deminuibacter soli]RFM30557.1 RHS repeat protein [Deminuibacter soli]